MARPQPPSLDKLIGIATEQDGFFTTAQARALGVDDSRLTRLVADGYIERVVHRVYRIAVGVAVAPHVREALYIPYLALDDRRLPWDRETRPRVVFSHESAAELLRIGNLPSDTARFTSEQRRTTTIPATKITLAPLPDDEWAFIQDGRAPTTTAARTIIDLALANVGRDYVERAAGDALRAGLTSRSELQTSIEQQQRPSLRWLLGWLSEGAGGSE